MDVGCVESSEHTARGLGFRWRVPKPPPAGNDGQFVSSGNDVATCPYLADALGSGCGLRSSRTIGLTPVPS